MRRRAGFACFASLLLLSGPAFPVCVTADESLCLNDRFAVTVDWSVDGTSGMGHVATNEDGSWMQKRSSGNIWMFGPDNLEFLVKVLDACDYNGQWWVFYSVSTNVQFTLTVTDTSGAVNRYTNTANKAAEPVQDTSAFSCDGPHYSLSTTAGTKVTGNLGPLLIDFESFDHGNVTWSPAGDVSYTPNPGFSGLDNAWFHRSRLLGASGHQVEVTDFRRLTVVVFD